MAKRSLDLDEESILKFYPYYSSVRRASRSPSLYTHKTIEFQDPLYSEVKAIKRSQSTLRNQASFLEGRVKILKIEEDKMISRLERLKTEANRIGRIKADKLCDLDYLISHKREVEEQRASTREKLALKRKLSRERIQSNLKKVSDSRKTIALETKSTLELLKSKRVELSTPVKCILPPFRFSRHYDNSRLDLSSDLNLEAERMLDLRDKLKALDKYLVSQGRA